MIFQELVPAEVDLRVTIVGDQVFAAAIHSQEVCRTRWTSDSSSTPVMG